MVLFALIFTPQSYLIVQGVRYGAQLRAICLIAMLALALTTPLPELEPAAAHTPEQTSLPTEMTSADTPQPAFAID